MRYDYETAGNVWQETGDVWQETGDVSQETGDMKRDRGEGRGETLDTATVLYIKQINLVNISLGK